MSARTLAERKREEEKQKRLDRIYKERSERAVREMEGECMVRDHPAMGVAGGQPQPCPPEPLGSLYSHAPWRRCMGASAKVSRLAAGTCACSSHSPFALASTPTSKPDPSVRDREQASAP